MSSPTRFNNVRVCNRHKWMVSAIAQTFNIVENSRFIYARTRIARCSRAPFSNTMDPSESLSFTNPCRPQKVASHPCSLLTEHLINFLGKACYFVRMVEEDVNTDVYCDNAVICGELTKNVLSVTAIHLPLCTSH